MADTADLRSEGELSSDPALVKNRQDYKRLKLTGTCVSCKKTETSGRSYCYSCTGKQTTFTKKYGLRSSLKGVGIDPDNSLAVSSLSGIRALSLSTAQADVISRLEQLLKEAKRR